MVSCGQFKMLPMAYATMGLPVSEQESALTTKPKIGFSIDSIVGMRRPLVSPERSPSPQIVDDDEDISVSRKSNSRTPSPHACSSSSTMPVKSPIPPVRPFPLPPKQMQFGAPSEGAPPPHFLAAQFQMAAALAHHHGHPPPPGFPMHHPAGFPVRDSYPLYPWLLSRHGRFFPHRFPGSEYHL